MGSNVHPLLVIMERKKTPEEIIGNCMAAAGLVALIIIPLGLVIATLFHKEEETP